MAPNQLDLDFLENLKKAICWLFQKKYEWTQDYAHIFMALKDLPSLNG